MRLRCRELIKLSYCQIDVEINWLVNSYNLPTVLDFLPTLSSSSSSSESSLWAFIIPAAVAPVALDDANMAAEDEDDALALDEDRWPAA